MNVNDLKDLTKNIVEKATTLKNKHTDEINAPVNYVCIFSHNENEYNEFLEITKKIGKIIQETPTGFLFEIEPLETISGLLRLLKIRFPDVTRIERGDADFTISNFSEFENKYLLRQEFKKIERSNFYMIELMDSDFDVRVYFSNPPLDEELNLK